MPLRPPSSAERARRGPFGALVVSVASDAAAARGLADAYAALDEAGRARLVDAVVSDARAEGVSPVPALTLLLSVESAEGSAHAIFAAIAASASVADGVRAPLAYAAGDVREGRALVIKPLFGALVEAFGARWTDEGVGDLRHDPLLDPAGLERMRARLGVEAREVPADVALSLVAEALWRHRRRHGALPAGADGLARLL